MKVLLIDNHTKHTKDWVELLETEGIGWGVLPYPECSEEAFKPFDLVILSGGSGMAIPLSRDILSKEIECIKNTSTPILGVCLGFELIADTFGATLKYREERVSGFNTIQVLKSDPIFGDLTTFTAKEAHKYYVDELPEELEALARSEKDIEVFKYKTKSIYGFQFHPEIISSENQGTQVLLNLLKQF